MTKVRILVDHWHHTSFDLFHEAATFGGSATDKLFKDVFHYLHWPHFSLTLNLIWLEVWKSSVSLTILVIDIAQFCGYSTIYGVL